MPSLSELSVEHHVPDTPARPPVPHGLPTLLEPGATNAIGRMLGVVGDEWTLLILQRALRGVTRYGRLLEQLPISNAVLSSRLAAMEREDLLTRVVYQERPVRAEYVLTSRGRALWPVLVAIWDWERRWVSRHTQTLPDMLHTACGRHFSPELRCAACLVVVTARDVDASFGPSGSWPRSIPDTSTRRRPAVPGREDTGLFPETMTIFGNRWSSALTGAALAGIRRFGDVEAALGAPPTVVADRLRAFCDIGFLAPSRATRHPERREYRLTDKGRAFYPAVALAVEWAQRWYVAPEGPAMLQRHRTCGADLSVQLTCDACESVVHGSEVAVVPRTPPVRRADDDAASTETTADASTRPRTVEVEPGRAGVPAAPTLPTA